MGNNRQIYIWHANDRRYIGLCICAGAFSRSVCEDFENREFRYYLARGNKLRYITSRSIVIFFGAVVCMIAGTILFVLACRISMPWVDTDGGDFYSGSAYFELIRQGHYLLYFILYALHMGLVAGTLSVVSAFTSLFIRNKVMVLAMPTLLYRLLLDFSIAGKDLYMLFPLYKCITNDALNFLFVFALTASTAAIFTVGMYFRIDKWL